MREELKMKFPSLSFKAQKGNARAAVKLFCVECMGGNYRDARVCAETTCPLHAFRPGTKASDFWSDERKAEASRRAPVNRGVAKPGAMEGQIPADDRGKKTTAKKAETPKENP